MTPFGLQLRKLREERGVTQKEMAQAIGVSPAYLSALEHGNRGRPSWVLLQRMVGYLNVIWDEAEALQRAAHLSNPKVVIDTTELSAEATFAANLLSERIGQLDEEHLKQLVQHLKPHS